jgi:hypothetical protein
LGPRCCCRRRCCWSCRLLPAVGVVATASAPAVACVAPGAPGCLAGHAAGDGAAAGVLPAAPARSDLACLRGAWCRAGCGVTGLAAGHGALRP